MTVTATQRDQLARITLMQVESLALNALEHTLIACWVRLCVYLITKCPEGRLNVSFPNALRALARTQVCCDETQIETLLETYAETQLITWDREAKTISLPDGLGLTARQRASRENGQKGGRPPGSKNRNVVADCRQKEILLASSGGKNVENKNLEKTPLAGARAEAKLASSLEDNKAKLDRAFHRIGKKAYEAVTIDPVRDHGNYAIARQWCADAFAKGMTEDQAERLIISVVTSVSEREKAKGNSVTFGYFSRAVQAAIAKGDIPEAPKSPELRAAERKLAEALANYSERLGYGETGLRRPELNDFLGQVAA